MHTYTIIPPPTLVIKCFNNSIQSSYTIHLCAREDGHTYNKNQDRHYQHENGLLYVNNDGRGARTHITYEI